METREDGNGGAVRKTDWPKWSSIAEIVGAAAVVVTLAFLTVQVRQNTEATESSTWQSIQDAESRLDAMLMLDPELLDIWERGKDGGVDSLASEIEKSRFRLVAKQLLDLFNTHHYQHELGIVSDELWGTWAAQFDDDIRKKGFREVVRARHRYLRPSFAAFVDEHLRSIED